ncbi:MAG: DNA polymerase IV, partial [Clostridiales bacterium]|nr:DNA polymerase IV [Clostridiales bacterium]
VTVSVGVSYNKIFAKLGSDMKKPDATTVITSERFQEIVWPLPVNDLLYVGRATHNKLKQYGIQTIGDLAKSDQMFLRYILGKNGMMLWQFANGLDISPVSNIGAKSFIKSVGNSTTAPRDLITDEDIWITLCVLCESVSARLREYGFICKTVQISVRDNELHSYERQGKLNYPNRTAKSLLDKAFQLYKQNHHSGKPIRSLGVRACNLELNENEQLSFFSDIECIQREEILESAVDDIRSRFGHFSIQRGILLADRELSSVNPKEDHMIHPESFFKN